MKRRNCSNDSEQEQEQEPKQKEITRHDILKHVFPNCISDIIDDFLCCALAQIPCMDQIPACGMCRITKRIIFLDYKFHFGFRKMNSGFYVCHSQKCQSRIDSSLAKFETDCGRVYDFSWKDTKIKIPRSSGTLNDGIIQRPTYGGDVQAFLSYTSTFKTIMLVCEWMSPENPEMCRKYVPISDIRKYNPGLPKIKIPKYIWDQMSVSQMTQFIPVEFM